MEIITIFFDYNTLLYKLMTVKNIKTNFTKQKQNHIKLTKSTSI